VDVSRNRSVRVLELTVSEARASADSLDRLIEGDITGIVVRDAVNPHTVDSLVDKIQSAGDDPAWGRPNRGMSGGNLRVIGTSATPTFTSPTGPTLELFLRDAGTHAKRRRRMFGDDLDPFDGIAEAIGAVAAGRPVVGPTGASGHAWPPYTLRSLETDQEIYPHHDDHYGLSVYEDFDPAVDRSALLSYFVTLVVPDDGGRLTLYGLQGTDPDPPILPTRFLDTEALDRQWQRQELDLRAGDLVVFNSGRHVHRVTPVRGPTVRVTIGGFLAFDRERSRVFCWS
jgi:hypothetical protein